MCCRNGYRPWEAKGKVSEDFAGGEGQAPEEKGNAKWLGDEPQVSVREVVGEKSAAIGKLPSFGGKLPFWKEKGTVLAMRARKGKDTAVAQFSSGIAVVWVGKSRENNTRSGREESSTTVIKVPATKRGFSYPH